ncbi:uncharacterized protein MELLADRAFT_114009 [Melampsora larici-populina 98AG31]|uniref:Uncharacterized protein n=1 Tax=Melampsora larici-populina (strain 98AG31 / pathotype 3-4-7) TaxID=747676 RepID=F4SBU5_MELLP|nr:uncharacterized protein MELLADRAFT_114009 [Melampsora larici-populina 98AG31]EGF97891.1 hypothetical protein MELLADRAFT_114009 [Melampsora larici-populina 98AG31]
MTVCHPESFNSKLIVSFVSRRRQKNFPDAASDAPACATGSTSSIDAPIVTEDQSTATTTEIRSSTATSRYPQLDSLQDLQNLKTLKPPTPPFFKLNTASRHAKRAASSEVKQSLNSTELGSDVCDISSKISKKKKIAHLSRTVIKPTNSTGAAIQRSTHPSAPGHSISNTTLTFDDNEKDLKDLHNSLATPALPLQNAVTKPNASKRNVIKRPPVSDQTQHQSVSQKPSDSETYKIQMLQKDKDCLKKTAQVTSTLNPKLTHLESRVETLQRRFNIDHEEIVTHGQILEKLMASDDDDDKSCD